MSPVSPTRFDVLLRIDASSDNFVAMREWLAEYASSVPRRREGVLAAFIWHTLLSNAQWDGVFIEVTVASVRPSLK